MVGTVPSAFHALFHSILQTTLEDRYNAYLPFANNKVKA